MTAGSADVVELAARRKRLDPAALEEVRRWATGETTWAEVEGMTFDMAKEIAKIGCELAGRGFVREAMVLFEGLVAGNPKDTSAQAALGAVYQRLGRTDEALACFDRAVELFDSNVVALGHRGELRLRKGDSRGRDDLRKAAAIDLDGISASGRRAKALLQALSDTPGGSAHR